MEGLVGSSGVFGREFPERGCLDFLEVALVWKCPYGILVKQTSKKLASAIRTPQTSKKFLQKRFHQKLS